MMIQRRVFFLILLSGLSLVVALSIFDTVAYVDRSLEAMSVEGYSGTDDSPWEDEPVLYFVPHFNTLDAFTMGEDSYILVELFGIFALYLFYRRMKIP